MTHTNTHTNTHTPRPASPPNAAPHRPPKYRASWAEIELGALTFNLHQLKSRILPGTLVMAVVKADGYGHGAVSCARAALAAGADWLGVATAEEAIELRAASLTAPILVFTQPPSTALADLIELDITTTATSADYLYELAGVAQLMGKRASFHLKINTGMNRLGVRPAEAVSIVRETQSLPHVALDGIYTHFATADIEGDYDAQRQLAAFKETLAALYAEGLEYGIAHAANSAATILMPDAHLDMVRLGIALYGLHPSDDTRAHLTLKPVMSVYAQATLVHALGIGEGVSYGLTWRAEVPCAIVTLPLGYADGVPRVTSGKLDLLHEGVRFEQVGRICMDQLMVRALQHDDLKAGDTFVLVGTSSGASGNDTISIDEIATKAGTINYEIACGLGRRLDRVYV